MYHLAVDPCPSGPISVTTNGSDRGLQELRSGRGGEMSIEIKQHLKLSQQLVMTPQLQQAIKLLQLSRMELVELVREEMMENPILEDSVETAQEKAREEEFGGEADGDAKLEHAGETEQPVQEQ